MRIISLAPSLTEMVFAVGAGDMLVGRTDVCNYPEKAAKVPIVGGFGKPSLERILQLQPDVVLEIALEDEGLGRKLDDMGIRRERIQCETLNDIPQAMRTIADIAGTRVESEEAVTQLEKEIASKEREVEALNERPRVFVEIWGDPVMTAGKGTFISDVVRLAGGLNIGDAGDAEYYQVASEWVIDKDPEVILCFYMAEGGSALERVGSRLGWGDVAAVKQGRIYDGFQHDIMLRPGPRVLDAVDALKDILGEKP